VSETRLEKLTVDKGLLRETEFVQRQLNALLKCDVSVRVVVFISDAKTMAGSLTYMPGSGV
jgi:hypothetical protein